MDYVIRNHKGVYVKLNNNGSPVTCVESARGLFDYTKAKNILASLPKPLKKLNFRVVGDSDIGKINEEKIIQKENYTLSHNVAQWLEKFDMCDEIILEAKKRKEELIVLLDNSNKEITDGLHKIELEKSKNAYQGFLEYKHIKETLEKRRVVKDELTIVSSILQMNFTNFSSKRVKAAIDGLATRKYSLRILEDNDDENL